MKELIVPFSELAFPNKATRSLCGNCLMKMDYVLVSSCLLGQPVRYNATAKATDHADILERWKKEGRLISFCPELAAGFSTPRPPAEIVAQSQSTQPPPQGADVINGTARILEKTGCDVTDLYLDAASLTVALAQRFNCSHAVLTDGSPSCGSTFIYDGTFSGTRISGAGATVAALRSAGIQVWPQTQIAELDTLLD